jgi:hypothetical protein
MRVATVQAARTGFSTPPVRDETGANPEAIEGGGYGQRSSRKLVDSADLTNRRLLRCDPVPPGFSFENLLSLSRKASRNLRLPSGVSDRSRVDFMNQMAAPIVRHAEVRPRSELPP